MDNALHPIPNRPVRVRILRIEEQIINKFKPDQLRSSTALYAQSQEMSQSVFTDFRQFVEEDKDQFEANWVLCHAFKVTLRKGTLLAFKRISLDGNISRYRKIQQELERWQLWYSHAVSKRSCHTCAPAPVPNRPNEDARLQRNSQRT